MDSKAGYETLDVGGYRWTARQGMRHLMYVRDWRREGSYRFSLDFKGVERLNGKKSVE
jgi:hypothetical protein